MKKLLCLLLPMLLLISGCSSSKYKLIKEDGNYYITYGTPSAQISSIGCEPEYHVPFKSMTEMKDAIVNVNFTDEQLERFSRLQPNARREGKIYFLNIDELYEPVYPLDLELTVECGANYYDWIFTNATGSKSIAMNPNAGQYLSERETVEAYIKSLEDKDILSVTNISDRNSTVIEYIDGHGNEIKSIYYTIKTGEKNLIVIEKIYTNAVDKAGSRDYIEIYGEQREGYFTMIIYKTDERPSVEWLSQFGIKEYVDP